MPIKVNLPTIPQIESVSLSDSVLIGSTAGTGLARLAQLSLLRALIGSVSAGALMSADDGHAYQLFGRVVDGIITISLVDMGVATVTSGSSARIVGDDGNNYELRGVTVDGQLTISANLL